LASHGGARLGRARWPYPRTYGPLTGTHAPATINSARRAFA
jgi:hypothetical protein